MAFVLIILGVIFATVISQQSLTVTTGTAVTDEPLSIASARLAANNVNSSITFTLANAGLADAGGWVSNSVFITNASGTSLAGNFTVNYISDTITFSNNTFMVTGGGAGNNTLVDYQYYPANYINSSFGRDALNMLGGFIALALIGVGIWLFYSIAKDYKIV